MRKFLKKMVLGDLKSRSYEHTHAIQKRIRNIKAIWNNDHNDDVGIEKIFRLF